MGKNRLTDDIEVNHQAPSSACFTSETTAQHCTDLSSVFTEVSVESVARYFGGNRYTPDEKTAARILRTISVAAGLAAPLAIYHLFKVSQTVPGEQLVLENGTVLSVPNCLEASGARLVGVAIGTLGAGLEEHCRSLAADGDIYLSTLFDAIGTTMLDLVSERICKDIAEHCKHFGLTRGPRFAPGIDDYPLENQQVLFELADHTSAGVSLNASSIMVPTKSISFFQTLTKTSHSEKSKNKCNQCRLPNCQFRVISSQIDS